MESSIEVARSVELTAEQYHSDFSAVSHSMLDEFIRSPERYWAIVNGEIKREQTAAMRIGSLLHSAMEGQRLVACPEEFSEVPADWALLHPGDVVEIPASCLTSSGARNTRGKDWKAFAEEHAGRVWMKADELRRLERYRDWLNSVGEATICTLAEQDQVRGMKSSILSHPWIKDVLRECPEQTNEFTVEWTGEQGLACKLRVDWITPSFRDRVLVLDWKKTRDCRPQACSKTSWLYGYHRQQAFYQDGLAAYFDCEPDDIQFAFVFVEDAPPYSLTVCDLDHDSMIVPGRDQNSEALRRLATARESGLYRRPAWNEVVQITAPRWAKYEEEWSSYVD